LNFEFTITGHDLTENEIRAYEAGANIKLPPQYRTFLMKHNGLAPKGMIYSDTGFEADVSEIYPLFLLDSRARTTVATVTKDLIWFAADSGGGNFSIAFTGKNFGKVFWVDMAHSEVEYPGSADCTQVASTLDTFLNSLTTLN
jgi:hypothetical protein